MSGAPDAERVVAERCAAVAARVRRRSRRLYLHVRDHTPEPMSGAEFDTLAHCAAFLAFVELGGDVERPAAFAWVAEEDALVDLATVHLRRDLRERGSDYHQVRYAHVLERFHLEVTDALCQQDPDREAAADTLLGLSAVLQPALTAQEWAWLSRHYLGGEPLIAIARELQGAEPVRYAGAKGLASANGRVKMTVMRARQKARTALDARWAETLTDALA